MPIKSPLEGPKDDALYQRNDKMDALQDALLVIDLGGQDLMMAITGFFQTIVAFPAIGQDLAAEGNVAFHKRDQLPRTTVLDDLHTQPSQFAPLAFNRDGHLALVISAAATLTAALAAKVEFIRFDLSRQRLAIGKDGAGPQLLQPAPSRLVTTKTQQFLQCDGTDTRLVGRKPPQGFKPDGERLLRPMKDGSGGYRLLPLALSAQVKSPGAFPILRMAAGRANKAFWPTKLEKILQAGRFVAETAIKLKLVLWVNPLSWLASNSRLEASLAPTCDIICRS